MSIWLQWLIIAPVVMAAAVFAFWRLLTPRLQRRVLVMFLRVLPANSQGLAARWRARIEHQLAASAADSCAACSRR